MPRFSFKKKDRSQKNSVDFNMPPSPASAGRHKQRRQSHSSNSTSNSSTKKSKPTTPGSNAPKSPLRKSIPKASSSSSKKTSRDNTSTSNGDVHVHVHGHKNAKKKQTPTSIIKSRRYGIQVQASGKGQKKDGDYADDSAYWKAAKQSIVDKRSKKKTGGSRKSSSDSRLEEKKLAAEKEASSKRREKKRQEKIAAQRRDKKARLQALKKKHDYSRGLKTPDFPTQKKNKKNEQDEDNESDKDSSDDDAAVAKSAFATKSLAATRHKNGAIAFAPSPSEISRGSLIPPTPAAGRSKIAAESPSSAVAESEAYFESPSKSPAKDDDINDGNNDDFEMGQDGNDTLDDEDVADVGGGDINQMEDNDARSSMHEEHVATSAIVSDNIGYVMGKTADIDIDSSRHEDSEAPSESGNNNTAPAIETDADMAVDDENIESVMGKTADVTLDVNTHASDLNSNNNELGTQDYGAQFNGDESDGFDDGGDENEGPGFELALEHNSDFSDAMASRGEEESSVTSPVTKRDEERSRVEDNYLLESPNRSETGSLSESGNPTVEKESLGGVDGMGKGDEFPMASRAGEKSSIGNGDTEDAVTPSRQQESDSSSSSSSSSSPDDRVKESELKKNRAKHLLREKELEAASKKQRRKRSRKRVSISTPEITYGTGGGYQVGNRDYTEIPVGSFQNDHSEDGNVRRSRRRRFPPVQFWKNEKIIYEANNATGRMAKIYGDMPMVKGILKAEPTPYKKRKQRPLVHDGDDSDGADVSITAAKTNAKSKSGEEKDFDSTKLRKKYNYEDGESAPIWLEAEGKAGIEKILCYRKKIKLHDLPLVKKRKRGESGIVAKASQTFNVAAQGNMPGFISGCMELPPQAIKDEESVGPCVQIFNVGNCQAKSLELAIADPEENEGNFDAATARRFLLSSGDVFHIPAGNVYRLQNHSKQIECNLSWTIMRPAQDRDA